MTAENFVDALQNQSNIDAEDAFKSAMASKVGDALEKNEKKLLVLS